MFKQFLFVAVLYACFVLGLVSYVRYDNHQDMIAHQQMLSTNELEMTIANHSATISEQYWTITDLRSENRQMKNTCIKHQEMFDNLLTPSQRLQAERPVCEGHLSPCLGVGV